MLLFLVAGVAWGVWLLFVCILVCGLLFVICGIYGACGFVVLCFGCVKLLAWLLVVGFLCLGVVMRWFGYWWCVW